MSRQLNTHMRAFEFITETAEPGRYNPAEDTLSIRRLSDTRKPRITLWHLNRLKKVRAARRLEKLKKEDFVQMMYGDPDIEQQKEDLELEHEQKEQELQTLKDEIALQIDKAEIDREQKGHIRNMAMNAVKPNFNSAPKKIPLIQ